MKVFMCVCVLLTNIWVILAIRVCEGRSQWMLWQNQVSHWWFHSDYRQCGKLCQRRYRKKERERVSYYNCALLQCIKSQSWQYTGSFPAFWIFTHSYEWNTTSHILNDDSLHLHGILSHSWTSSPQCYTVKSSTWPLTFASDLSRPSFLVLATWLISRAVSFLATRYCQA